MRNVTRLAAAVAAALLSLSLAGTASATDARAVITATKIAVMPGAAQTVFHDGDPIRICAGVETERIAGAEDVSMSIDEKDVRDGARWQPVAAFDLAPNTVGCMYAVVHGHTDSKLRVRVHRTKDYPAATSRAVLLRVA
jgi:hypothetical protein